MIRIMLIAVVLLHGLLHLVGFLRSFPKAGVISLTEYIPRSHGLLWLICALLFLLTGFLIILQIRGWIFFIVASLIISQVLTVLSWKEARFVSLINIFLLILSIIYLDNFLR